MSLLNSMEILNFNLNDIEECADLCYEFWSDEIKSNIDKHHLYNNLVSYYYRNKNYSLKIVINGKIEAFILAYKRDDKIPLWTSDESYLSYLKSNNDKLYSYAKTNDLIIGLLVSRKKGLGRVLIDEIKKHNMRLLLWTDNTCNKVFYKKIGFKRIKSFNDKFETIIYEGDI